MRALLILLVLAATPAAAHRLVLFGSVEAGEIVIETKFSNGRTPEAGTIRIYDGADVLLTEMPLKAGGETRFAPPEGAENGLRIEVETGAGHSDYWLFTPADLAGAGG